MARPKGYSPIRGHGGALIKDRGSWTMPPEDWDWLRSQPDQSKVLREAIALARLIEENEELREAIARCSLGW